MKSKVLLPSVVAFGVLTASPVWAVAGGSGAAMSASSGAAGSLVAGASGLAYGGQGISDVRAALVDSTPAEIVRDRAVQVGRSASDDADGGLAQILSGLALVIVLVGKRISG